MDSFNNSIRITLTGTEITLVFSMLFLTGCIAMGTRSTAQEDIAAASCRALYQEVDAVIETADVRDHGSSLVHGFPYFRTTRLLASFNHELNDESPQWLAWIGHMADLDAQARALELRNLPPSVLVQRKDTLLNELNRCRDLLITIDLVKPEHRARLRDIAHVPDDYVSWWQALGLYPLTAPIVAAGISAWHSKTRDIFATPLALLPVTGKLVRWKHLDKKV